MKNTGTKGAVGVGLGLAVALAGCTAEEPVGQSSHASHNGTLHDPVGEVRFSSRLEPGDSASGGPAICADTPCERIDVPVNLDQDVWDNPTTRGLEFSLQWLTYGDNLFMYVYKDGQQVAAAENIIATAESVIIPEAGNGTYSIYAALDPASVTDEFDFEGIVEVEHKPQPNPPRRLLPDLVPKHQENVTFETPLPIFFEEPPEPGDTCNQSEIEEDGAEVCLRFDQILANHGQGDLTVEFLIPQGLEDPNEADVKEVRQLVHYSDGSQVDEHQVDEWEYHDTHDHYHYKGFAQSRLWHSNANGDRLSLARAGDKVSFCMVDIRLSDIAFEGNTGAQTFAPDCLFPVRSENGFDVLESGISRGWEDVYDWFLPDQYIEVSGLPDGYYVMDTIGNPDQTIIEDDYSNNCTAVLIRLEDVDTDNRSVEVIGPGPSC